MIRRRAALVIKNNPVRMYVCKPTARGRENTWQESRKGNLRRRKKGFPWGSVGKGDYNAPCLCRFKQLIQSCRHK